MCRAPARGERSSKGACVQMWAVHVLAGTGLHAWLRPVCRPAGVHVRPSANGQSMGTPEAAGSGAAAAPKPGWPRAPGSTVMGGAGRGKVVEADPATLPPPLERGPPQVHLFPSAGPRVSAGGGVRTPEGPDSAL